MVMLLREAVENGTGKAASIGYGAAGKTGTTNKGVDLLFIGLAPSRERVTGIWLGNDDNRPTEGSSALAAELWGQYTLSIVN
jgi:peptidoglycan glycosyltransferase